MAIYRRLWCCDLGSTTRNSWQAGYANLWINWSRVKMLLMVFCNSCSNFTCQHHQTGSSCTCPIDMSSLVKRSYITVQNYSIHQRLWSAHLSKHMTTVVWCTYQAPQSYIGTKIFACRQNTIKSSFFVLARNVNFKM